jgi:uncharacterized protein involved in response to NO
MFAANVAFHLEARFTGAAQYSERAGITAIIMLVILVGGRVVPSFTRNWLVKENPGRLPAPADRLDDFLVAAAVIGAICWIIAPASAISAALFLIAAVAQTIRLVLHGAYLFIPVGFALHACAVFHPELAPPSAGIHAWAIGAAGGMILAVMTRATLGHTGRALKASRWTVLIYVAVAVSAVARIAAALDPQRSLELLHLAAAGWIVAFAGFAAVYGPYLAKPRRKTP